MVFNPLVDSREVLCETLACVVLGDASPHELTCYEQSAIRDYVIIRENDLVVKKFRGELLGREEVPEINFELDSLDKFLERVFPSWLIQWSIQMLSIGSSHHMFHFLGGGLTNVVQGFNNVLDDDECCVSDDAVVKPIYYVGVVVLADDFDDVLIDLKLWLCVGSCATTGEVVVGRLCIHGGGSGNAWVGNLNVGSCFGAKPEQDHGYTFTRFPSAEGKAQSGAKGLADGNQRKQAEDTPCKIRKLRAVAQTSAAATNKAMTVAANVYSSVQILRRSMEPRAIWGGGEEDGGNRRLRMMVTIRAVVSKVDRLEYAYAVYPILLAIPTQSKSYRRLEAFVASPVSCGGSDVGIA
ncbi:hypothetical protein Tco_1292033 [Tanacetum coccineum]